MIDLTPSISSSVCLRYLLCGDRWAGWLTHCPGHKTHSSKQAGVSALQLVGNNSQFMSANQRGLLKS